MKATARRSQGASDQELTVGGVRFAAEQGHGGTATDEAPSPEELLAGSLASCTAATMQTYARRKGWDIGEVVVEVDYQPAERGSPTRCHVVVLLGQNLPEEQRKRLMAVAAKSPVHRTLEGETIFDEHLQLHAPKATARESAPAKRPLGRNPVLRRLAVLAPGRALTRQGDKSDAVNGPPE